MGECVVGDEFRSEKPIHVFLDDLTNYNPVGSFCRMKTVPKHIFLGIITSKWIISIA